jgi:hypothetical protein
MLLTTGCVLLVLGGSVLLGLPLAWLLKGRRPLDEDDWLLTPFLGLAGAVLVLHNFVYFDYTVAQVTPFIWVATAGVWLWMLRDIRSFGCAWSSFPWAVFLAVAGVYCVHGLGLFLVGAHDYLGRAWNDQYNYTSLAQLFLDVPHSITWESLGQWPYLADGLKVKDDRIGVMLLQGFFACSLGADARTLFEPTIMLAPALLVPAVYRLARNLVHDKRRALATGVAAGLLPGIAALHFDCFMAHTVSIPFVMVNLLTLHQLVNTSTVPLWRQGVVLLTAILLATTLALYMEMALVLLGASVVTLTAGMLARVLDRKRGLVLLIVTPVLALSLNPLSLYAVLGVIRRVSLPTATHSPFEFAYNLRGLGCLWVSDEWAFRRGLSGNLVVAAGVAMTVLAVLGLGVLAWRSLRSFRRDADGGGRHSCPLILGVLAVACLPVALFLRDNEHPYQVAKLLLTASPLLVLGVACAADIVPRWRASKVLGWMPLASLLAIAFLGTGTLALRTAGSKPGRRIWLQSDWLATIDMLGSVEGRNVVLACGPGNFLNSWLAYAARHNNVWLVNPVINDKLALGWSEPPAPGLRPLPVGERLIDLNTVPHDALLLTREEDDPQVVVDGDCCLVWSNGAYRLWQLGPGSYRLLPTAAALRPSLAPPHDRRAGSVSDRSLIPVRTYSLRSLTLPARRMFERCPDSSNRAET